MHSVDEIAGPLSMLVAGGLVGRVGWGLWRAQRDVRAERLTSMRDHRRRVEALRRCRGPRVLP